MKSILLAAIALLCLGAIKPPVPKLPQPKVQIESPKGKEQHLAARVEPAAPRAVIVNNRLLTWTWSPNAGNPASNVVFIVRSSLTLAVPAINWPVSALCTTNRFPFLLNPALPSTFFHVQASNTVTHLVSVW